MLSFTMMQAYMACLVVKSEEYTKNQTSTMPSSWRRRLLNLFWGEIFKFKSSSCKPNNGNENAYTNHEYNQ